MKNVDVIASFITRGNDNNKTKHLRIEGDNLISYATEIAYRLGNKYIVVNYASYSNTTRIIQNMIIDEAYYKTVLILDDEELYNKAVKFLNKHGANSEIIGQMESCSHYYKSTMKKELEIKEAEYIILTEMLTNH